MLIVAALYQFAKFDTYKETQKILQDLCDQHKVKGTLLLAEEGINGTIAGTREGIDAVIGFIKSIGIFNNLETQTEVPTPLSSRDLLTKTISCNQLIQSLIRLI